MSLIPCLALLVSLLLALWVARLQRRLWLLQYLFFLRYPILVALALTLGPFFSLRSNMLRNLFELELPGVAITVGLSVLLGYAIVHTSLLIVTYNVARTGLPLWRDEPARQIAWAAQIEQRQGLWSVLLAAPFDVLVVLKSNEPWHLALVGALLGFCAVSFGRTLATFHIRSAGVNVLGLLTRGARRAIEPRQLELPTLQQTDRTASQELIRRLLWPLRAPFWLLGKLHGHLISTLQDGFYDAQGRLEDKHLSTLVGFAVSLVLYATGYLVMQTPIGDGELLFARVPALAHVLSLSLAILPLAGLLSFYCDKYRVPASLPVFALWFFSYTLVARDSTFPLVRTDNVPDSPSLQTDACAMAPEHAVQSWLSRRAPTGEGARKPTMVVVAASGGGITAAFWTARVLTALAEAGSGIADFQRAITMISSASGGGVGAAYFVDAYAAQTGASMTHAEASRVLGAAGASSLNETAFAIAYHDFLAPFLPLVPQPKLDRGVALEQALRRRMRDREATLGSWRTGIAQGWRPTQIFNATVAETGQRLLLSPLGCPTPDCTGELPLGPSLSMKDLPAAGDLSVVTAARLSATFPWVTPLSRPEGPGPAYHVADGGYYDNFGVVTALEWISRVHGKRPELADEIEKIILIEIRAFPNQRAKPQDNSGWLYASLGPLLTILNVRDTSQRDRNEASLSGLRALLAHPHGARKPVYLESVSFELNAESPLSWHLSERDRQAIKRGWEAPHIRSARKELSCLWYTPPERWGSACGREPAIDVADPQAPAKVVEQARRAAERNREAPRDNLENGPVETKQ